MADAHWRYTGNVTSIGKLDARAFSPFPALLIVKSWYVVILGIIFLVFFAIISRKGYPFSTFKRKIRSMVTGPTKAVRRLR
ncbi:IcmT/TraK family protein [Burkholderia pseudomallei]|uniref:IcmT/TraK family protein n=1 Tax=Burkholderia pseudomallei TaxID=28450 RepID=UPI0012F493C1|nr:IcmT/TraK family protein [Burkholderia pseudomallei]